MGPRPWPRAIALAGVVACAAAHGQLAPSTGQQLRPLDPGVADADPLSLSLRDARVDLRRPTGFQHVYQVPGRDDRYMRISGGIYAVFPQSMYAPTRHGPAPLIPAGTIFFVGPPSWMQPPALAQASEQPPSPLRVQTRVNARIDEALLDEVQTPAPLPPQTAEARDSAAASSTPAGPRIVSDQEYRGERIARLLSHAARANRQNAED